MRVLSYRGRIDFPPGAGNAHGPAWTRKVMGDQRRIIDDCLLRDCGDNGL